MSRLIAAVALLAALTASAANAPRRGSKTKLSRTAGKVFQASGDRMTIFDKAGHTEEFKLTPRTKVTLDGKPAAFAAAATPGTLVLDALYNSSTKELAKLELKSAPLPPPDADDPKSAGRTSGEVANTDVFKGLISVRSGGKEMREFKITDATKIIREVKGKPADVIQFEAIQIGEPVEIFSQNGKTALEVHVRAR